jgi:hypothetical protein
MNHGSNQGVVLLILIGVPLAYYWIQVARRKREVIRFKLRRVSVYIACILIGIAVIPSHGYTVQDAALFSMFVGTTAAFVLIRPPRTGRGIPKSVRRNVIARYEATGKKFDPKLHDMDHIVPFSKGGDHSEENLRVVDRSTNRRRGAEMPKFRDLI